MRVLIGALLVGLCAWQTHARAFAWRTDQALWTSATVTAPTLPRPWINLAVWEIHTGAWPAAVQHLDRGWALAQRPARAPLRAVTRQYARMALIWLDGPYPVCESDRSVPPLCALLQP